MPIPELEQARVRGALDEFCQRIPMHVRPELTNLYRFKGNSVTLIERRPDFQDRDHHTELEFAKFVYSSKHATWSLQWRDRKGRWHAYDGFQSVARFGALLDEVISDPTAIFFG